MRQCSLNTRMLYIALLILSMGVSGAEVISIGALVPLLDVVFGNNLIQNEFLEAFIK